MDQQSFDRLARLLGGATDRRAGLKAAVGALLGGGAAAAGLDLAPDAEAKRRDRDRNAGPEAGRKKRRKTCKPACTGGYVCEKVGKRRECVCPSGVACGAACCAAGQACEGGACADAPEPVECIAAEEPCKNRGRRCCDGRVCASGQGGDQDIACYSPKTGACTTTADCVYGMSCQGGRCAPPPPAGLAQACDATAQQLCTTAGATCAAYTAAGAPGGTYCTLPVGMTCTGDPECTCYRCFYPNGGVQGGSRGGRASANAKACCFTAGQSCESESQCCTGLSCVNGTCGGGTICAPEGGDCSQVGCCGTLTCNGDKVCVSGSSRTCTVNRDDYDTDEQAYAALKNALIAAQDDPANPAKNPVYVGKGTWVFLGESDFALELISKSADVPVKILACDPANRPVFDGNSAPTFAGDSTTVTPDGTEWPDLGGANKGYGIFIFDDLDDEDTDCGGDLGSGCAGFEVDGIDFRNANTTRDGSTAGAIAALGVSLKLSNSTITRCKDSAGGIMALADLRLENVTIQQCYGNSFVGGIYLQGRDAGNQVLQDVTIVNNGVTPSIDGATGGIRAQLNTGEGLDLTTVSITNNARAGIGSNNGTVTCVSGVTISGNTKDCSKIYVGSDPTFTGCPCSCPCQVA